MSEHLFRKPASAVTLPEAALIAGLIRAPSTLSPWSNYDGALERSHVVLAQMRAQGFITPAQEEAARRVAAAHPAVPPAERRARRLGEGVSAAAVPQRVRRRPSAGLAGAHDVRAARCRTPRSGRSPPGSSACAGPGLEAALVAIDPPTGDILAMVGGADYARSTFNRATRSRRQPGSAFKPFVYAAALAHGYSPVSVLSNLRHVTAPERSGVEPAQRARASSPTR